MTDNQKILSASSRLDHKIIDSLIPENSKVLDLGCGDGSLLKLLSCKRVTGQGIEIDGALVKACISKGISVLQQDLDQGLADYKDFSFDFVILNKTLQATHQPLLVLKEALRIGRKVLVSFPNFGYWVVRSQLFFGGYMPKSRDLPYEWYDTPNIHLVTISDFARFCHKHGFAVEQTIFYNEKHTLAPIFPNLLSPYALFVLKQKP